jgi:hypothetical protein
MNDEVGMSLTAPLVALLGPKIGGIVLTDHSEQSWFSAYEQFAQSRSAFRQLPTSVTVEQLIGGLDLAATLAGRTSV